MSGGAEKIVWAFLERYSAHKKHDLLSCSLKGVETTHVRLYGFFFFQANGRNTIVYHHNFFRRHTILFNHKTLSEMTNCNHLIGSFYTAFFNLVHITLGPAAAGAIKFGGMDVNYQRLPGNTFCFKSRSE